MKKKICVITGTRADYGILYPVMKAIQGSKKLDLHIIATCMHFMEEFGNTYREIAKDGFNIYEKIDTSYKEDTRQAMAFSVGKALSLFSKSFQNLNPDIVLLLGDRGEMLSAAIAANYMNIPVAHIHGGELSGHIDGLLRHAITKLSHIHFPATNRAKERILKLGEEPQRIFVCGAPALDRVLKSQFTTKGPLIKKYKININEPIALLVQNPISTEEKYAYVQMKATLEAISGLRLQTIVVYPNADVGGRMMIRAIKEYEKYPFVKSYKSLPHEDFLGLMKVSSVLIGNSSSGIIEAPSFKLPVVNLGTRQQGRERSTNIIDVPHDEDAIVRAIKKAIYDTKFRQKVSRCKNPYGDGRTSQRIVEILSNIELDTKLLQKRLTY